MSAFRRLKSTELHRLSAQVAESSGNQIDEAQNLDNKKGGLKENVSDILVCVAEP
jgi:hypothetical protein